MMIDSMDDTPLFFMIAGETSGDVLGARLMQGLRKRNNNQVRFAGIGGPRMRAEGMDLFFPQAELAQFGLFELLRHVPHLLSRIRQTTEKIQHLRPTALITIDAPDFCFRVAKTLRARKVTFPMIHYVAPTVWAWRPHRARKIAQFLDHLMVLLPFEPPYFTKEGLACTFVGHSIVEGGADHGDAERFCTQYKVKADSPLLALLPGSRMSEAAQLMPLFRTAVETLEILHPGLQIVIPVAPNLRDYVAQQVAMWRIPVIMIEGDKDKYDAFAAAQAALACSGTVAIEMAMARLPAVIVYKINKLTAFLYRRLIKVKFANLVNIMHDRMVVPELLQEDCTSDRMAAAVHILLSDKEVRRQQVAGLAEIAEWLGRGKFVPSERAAETVLNAVRKPPKRREAA
jgi:lipid-A-disaccharide synthase